MALSFPESRDMTADSIVAITINLQLIVVVNFSLELLIVSDQLLVQKVCSEWSQIFTLVHCIFLSYQHQHKRPKVQCSCATWVSQRWIVFSSHHLVFVFFQGAGSDETEVALKQKKCPPAASIRSI